MASSSSIGTIKSYWRDKWLLVLAFILLWQARVAISLRGFGDPRRRCFLTADKPAASPGLARRISLSIDRAAHLVPASTCLIKAVAGQRLLTFKGYGSEIRIGVRKDEESQVGAHAWLVSGDLTVLGGQPDELERFQILMGRAE